MGQFFSFGKKTPAADSVAASPAAAETPNLDSAGHPILERARENARTELGTSPRRRGRPSKDQASLQPDSRTLPPDLQAEINKQIEGALDPRAWAALLALPADSALAITGREHWKISKEERETLGATGSAMARTMMITNPRLLCAIMVSSALFSVYVPRAAEELKFQKAKKDALKKVPKPETT